MDLPAQHRGVAPTRCHAVGHGTAILGVWRWRFTSLVFPAATPPFPTRFTECRQFYEALQSQTHTRQTQPEQHLCGFASQHERNL